ncbi:MAG TPA: transposase [Candidatus Bathyarchaeia archaeon]|nr:transposase [Candidatus Bathyarchaeia archaeon]
MRAVKVVQQYYTAEPEILCMLEQFRQMLNDCVRIGLSENVTSLKSLSKKAYHQLATYQVMSYYKLCAISKASGILRNYRKAVRKNPKTKEPYARRRQLITCYGFKIRTTDKMLLLPFKPKQPLSVMLNAHVIRILSEPNIQVRSVTLTDERVSICYAKEVEPIQPRGLIAIDRNLDNLTLADSDGRIMREDLTRATLVKARYREIRSHMRRNDQRIHQQVSGKYGRKQSEKVKQILHHASKQIVMDAKRREFGLVMEKLTDIRKLYRKGNWQGRGYRGRMNSWSYYELQRQIEYKAHWEGIPVTYVNPNGTSVKCSICGSRMKPEENRTLRCRSCGFTVDRDVNAARNILARALRFGAVASAAEAMVQEPQRTGNLESRCRRVNKIGEST